LYFFHCFTAMAKYTSRSLWILMLWMRLSNVLFSLFSFSFLLSNFLIVVLFIAVNCRALTSNRFSGPIPNSIGNLSSLYYLDLTDNQLSGSIPVSSGTIPGLDMLLQTRHLYVKSHHDFKLINSFLHYHFCFL
jgi:Leucine-rich repeat (LRR) protein